MKLNSSWFDVSKAGLAKLREGSPKSAMVMELVQNCWDTNATICDITIEKLGNGLYELEVADDDPNGFKDLSHAYTLFAESEKKTQATKRGRFNIGEKLVLALCQMACIESTTGTVVFHQNDTRQENPKNTIPVGSRFTGQIRMNQRDVQEIRDALFSLLPPSTCKTTFNGEQVPCRDTPYQIQVTLPTVIGDDEGVLRPSRRKTTVEIHEVEGLEEPMIYEMGIPVVASGDKYHVNVMQKIPLTLDRTNVTPAFLRDIRHAVAEAMRTQITVDDANQTWVREAAANPDASPALVRTVFESRFGKDAVVYDPSDPEANKRALDAGRRLVYGSQMNKEEWNNVRQVEGLAPAAGKVFFQHRIDHDPEGREWTHVKVVTPGMLKVAQFCRWFAENALQVFIQVDFLAEPTQGFAACYGGRRLAFNVGRMGAAAFENGLTESLIDLIIHELAHEKAMDHLSEGYYKACTMLGARCTALALGNRMNFEEAGWPNQMAGVR